MIKAEGIIFEKKIIQGLKKISEKCLVMLGQSAGITIQYPNENYF
jgi:hypothetical protein